MYEKNSESITKHTGTILELQNLLNKVKNENYNDLVNNYLNEDYDFYKKIEKLF